MVFSSSVAPNFASTPDIIHLLLIFIYECFQSHFHPTLLLEAAQRLDNFFNSYIHVFITASTHTSKCRLAYLQGLPESFNSCGCMAFRADILKTLKFIETTEMLWFLEEMWPNHIPLSEKWLLVRQIGSQNNKTSITEFKKLKKPRKPSTKQKHKSPERFPRAMLQIDYQMSWRKRNKIYFAQHRPL